MKSPLGFRQTFAYPAGRETVRAFVLFAVLLAILLGIAGQLAFREVSVAVLTERLDLVNREAREIADAVAVLGREAGGIDFSRIRENESSLRRQIEQRFKELYFIHHIEIQDRFGVRQFFFSRESLRAGHRPTFPGVVPVHWPEAAEQIVRVPLGGSEGEVSVGLSAEPMVDDLKQLRRSLRIKVAVATLLAVGALVTGFFYILFLLRKNRRLERSRESAARASYVGLLASGLAHEIRNPLNAMNMNLQMLEEEMLGLETADDGECGELLDQTKREIKRLEQLVNNFLAYARPARPRVESRDLNEVVGEVVRFLDADFRRSEVELATDLEPLLPHVELDEAQFKQALMNLLVNARQVLEPGGKVTISTHPDSKGEVVLEVADNGPGIPPEAHGRIFEVFYSSRGGGTGLGLPIARQVIERHGGRIELQSEVGRGTTFRIYLPRRHPRTAPVEEPAP